MRISNDKIKFLIIEQLGINVFSDNKISKDNLSKIKKIKLDLSDGNVTTKDLEIFPKLEELYLIGENIKDIKLNKLSKLSTLKIKTNKFSNIPDLKKIKKLNDLSVELIDDENVEETNKFITEIEKLKNLNYLELINISFSSFKFLRNLKDLYELKIINKDKHKIKDINSLSILYLETLYLENISMNKNEIKYINRDAKEISLINCDIEKIDIFKEFKKLKKLDLSYNDLEKESLKIIKEIKDQHKKIDIILTNNNVNSFNIKGTELTYLSAVTSSKPIVLNTVEDYNYNIDVTKDSIKYVLVLDNREILKTSFIKDVSSLKEVILDLKENRLDDQSLDAVLRLNDIRVIIQINDFTKITIDQLKKIKYSKSNILFNISTNILRKKEVYNIDEFIEMYIKICDIVNNAPKCLNDIDKIAFSYIYVGNNFERYNIINSKYTKNNEKTLYNLLVNKKGYDYNFADLLKLILTALNVKTNTIEAIDENNKIHTWNQVLIFNTWYNTDIDLDLKEIKQGKMPKYFIRGDLDFSHDKYKYDCNVKCANYGMDLEVLLKQLYIMNKKLSQKIPA